MKLSSLLLGKTLPFAMVLLVSACNEQEFYEKKFLLGAGVERPDIEIPEPEVPVIVITDPEDGEDDDNNGGGTTNPPVDPTPIVVITDPEDGDDDDDNNGGGGTTNPPVDPTPIVVITDPEDGDDDDDNNGGGGTTNPPVDPTPIVVITDPEDEDDEEEQQPVIKYIDKAEKFVQNVAKEGKVDILWVVDDSGSMGDEQEALAYNFNIFIHSFLERDVDFRMAITTTDTTSKVDGKWTGHYSNLSSEAAKRNEAKFIQDFKKQIKVGTNGSGYEKGLQASKRFFDRYQTGTNDKFLRDDAYLIVVYLSDEEDQSSSSVATYVSQLQALKEKAGMVKAYSIVATKNTGYQWETIGHRYMAASTATNGVISHIKDDFYDILKDMGEKIVDLTKSFVIEGTPAIDLKVTVNGVEQAEGFKFDSSSKALSFNEGFIPTEGAEIIVTYKEVEK